MPLDEIALRRETFTPGVLIKLWDGQEWQFPRPWIAWRLTHRDDVPAVSARTTLGPQFDAAVKAFDALDVEGGSTVIDMARAILGIGVAMLVRNYDLTEADLYDLLVYEPENPENVEVWKEILAVAQGNAPKPTPGG